MSIFDHTDYRECIRARVNQKKSLGHDINFEKVADQARLSKAYLSRVLGGKAQLNKDQMFALCRVLKFSDEESEWLQLLLDRDRCGLHERQKILDSQIAALQRLHLRTEQALSETQIAQAPSFDSYYLDPWVTVVHICLGLEKYCTDLPRLARDLDLPIAYVLDIVDTLTNLNLVAVVAGRLHLEPTTKLHLPEESPLAKVWHRSLRTIVDAHLSRRKDPHAYNFSATFTAQEKHIAMIRQEFLSFIKTVQKRTAEGPAEVALQLGFGLSRWDQETTPNKGG